MRIIAAFPYDDLKSPPVGLSTVHTVGTASTNWPNPINVGINVEYATPGEIYSALRSILEPTDIVIPMSEESVLPVARAAMMAGARSLSMLSAVLCTDRLLQRSALGELSPEWQILDRDLDVFVPAPWVVRSRVSMESSGVDFASARSEIADAAVMATERSRRDMGRAELSMGQLFSSNSALIEHFETGARYEVVGISTPGGRFYLHPLIQEWSKDNRAILEYRRADPEMGDHLRMIAGTAVDAMRLHWSMFSVEIIAGKVIEVNARIGWDKPEKGYREALSDDGCPEVELLRMAQEAIRPKRRTA